ncbi:unnamed protein product [Sphagnum balticum]
MQEPKNVHEEAPNFKQEVSGGLLLGELVVAVADHSLGFGGMVDIAGELLLCQQEGGYCEKGCPAFRDGEEAVGVFEFEHF